MLAIGELPGDHRAFHVFKQGARIGREKLIRLFARILRKDENGKTYLVTPVEKIEIQVEAAPFLAVRVDRTGEGQEQNLGFLTNMDDAVIAGLAMIGVLLIAGSMQGYLPGIGNLCLNRVLEWPIRLGLIVAGLALAIPGGGPVPLAQTQLWSIAAVLGLPALAFVVWSNRGRRAGAAA